LAQAYLRLFFKHSSHTHTLTFLCVIKRRFAIKITRLCVGTGGEQHLGTLGAIVGLASAHNQRCLASFQIAAVHLRAARQQ
jgi:hypothetical protein